jgi:hypothetical protein
LELQALWEITGSSLGALRELGAVAGINRNYKKNRCDTDRKIPSEEKGMGETKPV